MWPPAPGPLYRHGEHPLANRWATMRRLQTTGLIHQLDPIQLLSDPYQSTDVADQSRRTVRVEPKSATGAGSAEPHTACRANGRCLAGPTMTGKRCDRPPTDLALEYVPSFS